VEARPLTATAVASLDGRGVEPGRNPPEEHPLDLLRRLGYVE
jgi:hypothetical protein